MSERAVIYTRISSHEQQANYSLPTQQERCRAHAEAKGWTVVAVESEWHSGADLHGREGLQRALALIENGGADILLAFATDRLSREQLHIGVILDRVLRAVASLQFVTEDFENSPTGKFLLSARTFAAELELAKIGERTQRGRRAGRRWEAHRGAECPVRVSLGR
jgi:site-specific DNA recombinase